jgi:hypothetical protein
MIWDTKAGRLLNRFSCLEIEKLPEHEVDRDTKVLMLLVKHLDVMLVLFEAEAGHR